MKKTNENAVQFANAQKQTATEKAAKAATKPAATEKAGTAYADRMRAHMNTAHTPSKCIKNAFATSQTQCDIFGDKYAKAVASVFDTKDAEKMKNALSALIERYKGTTPKRGYSEYYVHQYFEKLIKSNLSIAECRNYYIAQKATAQSDKTATK